MSETREPPAPLADVDPVRITVRRSGGLVVCEFPRATRWVGLRPAEALALAEALRTVAREAAAAQVQ